MNAEPSIDSINKLSKVANDLLGFNNIKIIFEFGSRYGEDTMAFADRYPLATIYAFECNPNTLPACRKNISAYNNIILTEKAISDKNGPISFYKIDKEKTETTWEDGNQGASSLLEASGKYPVENYVQEKVEVDGITLFSFIEENNLPAIDILWMDIQGAELMALKGLSDHIQKVKIIHLEVEFFEIYKDQPLFNDIQNFLFDNDFELLGFSSQHEYSGDAIFINRKLVSARKINKCKKALLGQGNLFSKIYSVTKKGFARIKRFFFDQIKLGLLSILHFLKKIRHFDKSFSIYIVGSSNSRSFLLWRLMVLNPLLNKDVNFRKNISSELPIDVFIPASAKDIETLKNVVANAKLNIHHPINNIYIVAPADCEEIVDICKETGAIFINENEVLGYNKSAINYIVNNQDRSGWLFQQLLKLSADKIVEKENFLILDADTIFIKPKVFVYEQKAILDMSQERHEAYHRVYEQILKIKTTSKLSFITHYMLFNKMMLKDLKAKIELIHNESWDKVILNNVDYTDASGFSEYETYGNFLLAYHPSYVKQEYSFNATSGDDVPNYIKSVSAHTYLNNSGNH
ncbi:FkbM family methyltransferase [Mucilaginibacter sp. L196]|uniref:FkbM family methyltransferase n=1 Tax=Mucilaginibacter sp. L196 TaxID=1641870 RepID=UPI00131D5BE9|nr:FkbM family methyltransferase [Mucilaginibacter sp. L196]